jgi:hypothetical protein
MNQQTISDRVPDSIVDGNKDNGLVEARSTQHQGHEEPHVIRWICIVMIAALLVVMQFAFRSYR